MAKDQKPDFSCQTNDKPDSVVDAPCRKSCKVTYRFAFRSRLSMPYAVAVNGKVLPAFKDRPKRTEEKIPLVPVKWSSCTSTAMHIPRTGKC